MNGHAEKAAHMDPGYMSRKISEFLNFSAYVSGVMVSSYEFVDLARVGVGVDEVLPTPTVVSDFATFGTDVTSERLFEWERRRRRSTRLDRGSMTSSDSD